MSTRTKIAWTQVTGRKLGVIRRVSRELGLSPREYCERMESQKRCSACKQWKNHIFFGKDASRGDGLCTICNACRKFNYHKQYKPKTGPRRYGPLASPGRDGDKLQSRSRVNRMVEQGKLSDPNMLPCADCGHLGDGRRHEYDHYLGYAAEHHIDVQAVCTICHGKRARDRGEYANRQRKPRKLKQFCSHGHTLTRHKDGGWRCAVCRREYWKKYNKERRCPPKSTGLQIPTDLQA
jgi:hypothetical protein